MPSPPSDREAALRDVVDLVTQQFAAWRLYDEHMKREKEGSSAWLKAKAKKRVADNDLDQALEMLALNGVTVYKPVLMEKGLTWLVKQVRLGARSAAKENTKRIRAERQSLVVEDVFQEQQDKLRIRAAAEEALLQATATPLPPVSDNQQRRLYEDFVHFLNTCIQIPYRPGMLKDHPDGGFGFFRPTQAQMLLIAELMDCLVRRKPVRIIVLKSRQLGCTTLLLAFWLWLCLTVEHFTMMLIIDKNQHNQTKKQTIVGWLEYIEKHFPFFPTIKKKEDNIFWLTNGSILMFESAEARNPGTSERLNCLHESEKPKWPATRARLVMTSIMPGIPETPFTFHVNESTAEGMDQFYMEWQRAVNSPQEGYTPLFFPWYLSDEYYLDPPENFTYLNDDEEVSERDENGDLSLTEEEYSRLYNLSPGQTYWRRHKIKVVFKGDRDAFDQEYPTTPDHAWRAVSSSFFTRSTLDKAQILHARPPVWMGDLVNSGLPLTSNIPVRYTAVKPMLMPSRQGELKVWEAPIVGRRYFLGGDVGEGKTVVTESGSSEPDATNLRVKDEAGRVVASYYSHVRPEEAWVPLLMLAVMYNNAWVNVERNASGQTLCAWFLLTGYPHNLVWPKPKGRPADERTWTILTKANRRPFLNQLRASYNAEPSRIMDQELINELRTFVVNPRTGEAGAQSGSHDDRVMADLHAEICRLFFLGLLGAHGLTEVVEGISEVKESWDPSVQGYRLEDTVGLEGEVMWPE